MLPGVRDSTTPTDDRTGLNLQSRWSRSEPRVDREITAIAAGAINDHCGAPSSAIGRGGRRPSPGGAVASTSVGAGAAQPRSTGGRSVGLADVEHVEALAASTCSRNAWIGDQLRRARPRPDRSGSCVVVERERERRPTRRSEPSVERPPAQRVGHACANTTSAGRSASDSSFALLEAGATDDLEHGQRRPPRRGRRAAPCPCEDTTLHPLARTHPQRSAPPRPPRCARCRATRGSTVAAATMGTAPQTVPRGGEVDEHQLIAGRDAAGGTELGRGRGHRRPTPRRRRRRPAATRQRRPPRRPAPATTPESDPASDAVGDAAPRAPCADARRSAVRPGCARPGGSRWRSLRRPGRSGPSAPPRRRRSRPSRSRGAAAPRCGRPTRRRTSRHERGDVVGRAARIGLDEVRVLVRDRCGSDPQTLGAGRVDQPAGRVAGRVGEHRSGVLAAGLVLTTPPDDLATASPRPQPTSPGASCRSAWTTTWERRSEERR